MCRYGTVLVVRRTGCLAKWCATSNNKAYFNGLFNVDL